MLAEADVLEFQQLFFEKFGKEISLGEARKRANNLVLLLSTLTRPQTFSSFDRLGDINRPESSVHR